jgi:hypothetical protein
MVSGVRITLEDAARRIGATVITPGCPAAEIDRICAADRISDLLDSASDRTLLVTNLAGPQLLHVAELMDVPGICLTGGDAPGPEMVRLARSHGTLLMVSTLDMAETCARLHGCFGDGGQAGA